MATIVLVHGIAQEQKSADTLEEEWLPDLAGGVRTAGFPEIADRLYRLRSGPDGIDTRMAFYGDLFLRGDQQGLEPEELSRAEQALAEQLAMEWTARAASQVDRREEPPGCQPGTGAAAANGGRGARRTRRRPERDQQPRPHPVVRPVRDGFRDPLRHAVTHTSDALPQR